MDIGGEAIGTVIGGTITGAAWLIKHFWGRDKRAIHKIDTSKHDGSNLVAVYDAADRYTSTVNTEVGKLITDTAQKLTGYFMGYLRTEEGRKDLNLQNNKRVVNTSKDIRLALRESLMPEALQVAYESVTVEEAYERFYKAITASLEAEWGDEYVSYKTDYLPHCKKLGIEADLKKIISKRYSKIVDKKNYLLSCMKSKEEEDEEFVPYRVIKKWEEIFTASGYTHLMRG